MKGNNWGGKRAGAGRKKALFKRTGRTFRLTDEEFLEVKPLIDEIRKRTEEKVLAKQAVASKRSLGKTAATKNKVRKTSVKKASRPQAS